MAMASAPACSLSELVAKGRESAASLRAILRQQQPAGEEGPSATPAHGLEDLAEQILRNCDRALAALRDARKESAAASRKRKPEHGPSASPPATSSKRMRLSGGERATTRVEKKWTIEDGFLWRKYSQKEIHGSKYPRLYFRCSYKEDHGCMARRQVQQSEDDPSVYLINYFGDHTCRRDEADDGAPESPEPFVINFGASTIEGQLQPSGSPAWPSSDDDGPVVSETSSDLCHSPADEKGMGNAAELIEKSTPVAPELTSMSSPEWDRLDGCLVWDMGLGESLFEDIGEFTHLDYYVRLFQLIGEDVIGAAVVARLILMCAVCATSMYGR